MNKKFKHALVFGVFDKFHEGHRFFLRACSERAEKCTVEVARDAIVRLLKNKKPFESENTRLKNVLASGCATHAELGDEELHVYHGLKRIRPDVIFFGYDQETLKRDLEGKMSEGALPKIPLIMIEAHEPHRYHTSLMTENSEQAAANSE